LNKRNIKSCTKVGKSLLLSVQEQVVNISIKTKA
jgi:hypothetical protein